MCHIQKYLLETLRQLLSIPSPTGHTEAIKAHTKTQLEKLGYLVEAAADGLRVTLESPNAQHVVWASHLDTLGLKVTGACLRNFCAYAQCEAIGGFDLTGAANAPVTFFLPNGKTVNGFLVSAPFGRHARPLENTAELMYHLCEFNTFECRLNGKRPLAAGTIGAFESVLKTEKVGKEVYLESRHLDSKADVAVMLTLLWHWQQTGFKPPYTVSFVFNLREEISQACSLIPLQADICIGLEWMPAESFPHLPLSTLAMISQDAACASSLPLMARMEQQGIQNFKEQKRFASDATLAKMSGFTGQVATIGPLLDNSHGPERMTLDGLLKLFTLMKDFSC